MKIDRVQTEGEKAPAAVVPSRPPLPMDLLTPAKLERLLFLHPQAALENLPKLQAWYERSGMLAAHTAG